MDTKLIADIARMVSWPKLWDLALDDGPRYVNALRAFVRIITYPSRSIRACPICNVESLDSSLLAHTLDAHTDSDTSYSVSDILDSLRPSSISIPDSNSQAFACDVNLLDVSSTTHLDLSSNSDTHFLT